MNKGKMFNVSGRIQVRSWETSQGEKRWTTEVVVEEQEFAESKKAEEERLGQPSGENIANSDNYPQADAAVPQQALPPNQFDPFVNAGNGKFDPFA